ncbi:TPA: class III lanthipeptide, partial [Streptococcus pyogenes]|nr:class III lanthipeptide [Streptococcus pyogenes]
IVDDLFNSEDNDLSTVSISCKKESTVSIFICVRPPKE